MKNKTYVVLAGLLVTALLATIVSCGPQPTAEPTPRPQQGGATPVPPQTGLSGEISIAGSTTVQPLTEVLAQAFMDRNPNVVINVQGGGSSVGVTSAGEGTVDIGMASRAIKTSEFDQFPDMQVFAIAYDGIAIVTHPGLTLASLSLDQVRAIFSGEITNYAEVGGPNVAIVVVSREEGSGTRGAFEELVMGDALISENAILQQSNGAVRTTVAGTPNSIAYLSFGFLDDSVRPVAVDGAAPTVDNVLSGAYPVFRPLNMLTSGSPTALAQAFLDFILSADGQAIVADDYISVTAEAGGVREDIAGEVSIAGSTTVQPLTEELAQAFMDRHPGVVINVQGGGSSVGVTSAGEGTVDIGMASRAIKTSEFDQFPDMQVFVIAYDGIAIVTHPGLTLPTLSVDQVRAIFSGEITNYAEVGGPNVAIVVVSREEGSGTRGAFEELVMRDALISENAILQQSNGAVRTTVAGTPNSIAYLSFGFLDGSVRTVPIDNVEPTSEHVLDGSYPIFRPLNLLTNGAPGELAQAFLSFILSRDGQAIVAEDYIPVR